MKIDHLTPKQEARLIEFRSECFQIGRSTAPSDRKKAEESLSFMYKKGGFEKPKFFWFDGHLTGYIGIEILKKMLKDGTGDNLLTNLGTNLGANLGANLRANLNNSFWGQHETAWIAFYDFPEKEIGLNYGSDKSELLSKWFDISKSTGWWVPFKDICFCFERHSILNLDDQGRLHCESGPAMGFRDGHAIHAWHGVRVKDYVIENLSQITVKDIEEETNTEVKRVKIERYGQAKYLLDSGAKEIHHDDFGTLYRKDVQGDEALVMVKCVNSSPEPDGSYKDYFLRVPPNMERARQAIGWTFGKEEMEYQPILET